LADRPSSASLYGSGGLTPKEVKAAYDKLPKLIANHYNALIDAVHNGDTSDIEVNDGEEEISFAAYIIHEIKKNLPEILSAAGVILSAVICIIMRSSVLPMISGGMARLSETVSMEERKNEAFIERAEEKLTLMSDRSDSIAGCSESINRMIESTNKKIDRLLSELERASKEREVVKSVMEFQSEMFDRLIESSALPQWKKDELSKEFIKSKNEINKLSEKGDEVE
ncbi:MAG: hypothetical protein IJF55_04460, partial [Clostridia bacterium]|nr:hypothetical protein [Clostridia bacterium]